MEADNSFQQSCLTLSPYIHKHKSYIDANSGEQLGGTALHKAVDEEHEDVVEVLLEANADPDLLQKVICLFNVK